MPLHRQAASHCLRSAISANLTMKKLAAFLCSVTLTFLATGQTKPKEYYTLVKTADSLYKAKDFKHSALTYSLAFKANHGIGNVNDKYNAACSWALANNQDSSFSLLYRITEKGNYSGYNHIIADSDLVSLHTDKRWLPLIEKIKMNKEKAEANLDKPLVALLDTIFTEDQGDRIYIDTIQKQYGWQSKQMDSLMTTMAYHDSINLVRVKQIIETRGWLGTDKIGERGATTLFLVIQHSDSLTQMKYLPLMRQAVKEGKVQPQQLALLEDRILTNQRKKQIYGSQVRTNPQTGKYEFFPIEDEPNVNERREAIGLEPLEDYARRFGIDYVLPKE